MSLHTEGTWGFNKNDSLSTCLYPFLLPDYYQIQFINNLNKRNLSCPEQSPIEIVILNTCLVGNALIFEDRTDFYHSCIKKLKYCQNLNQSLQFSSSYALRKLITSRNKQCLWTNIQAYFCAKWRLLLNIYLHVTNFEGLNNLIKNIKSYQNNKKLIPLLCHPVHHLQSNPHNRESRTLADLLWNKLVNSIWRRSYTWHYKMK